MAQNLRHTVISKHRQSSLVCEDRHVGTIWNSDLVIIVGADEISDEDLSSLIEEDLAALVDSLVSEPWEGTNDSFD